jgi:hypothetical protein
MARCRSCRGRLDRRCTAEAEWTQVRGLSEVIAQLVDAEVRISEDAAERPALELPMERHDEECSPLGMTETDVTATWPNALPAEGVRVRG